MSPSRIPDMLLVHTIAEVKEAVGGARLAGQRVGLVPTMGFLHEGHLSLLDRCHEQADYVVMSIFVNPLQFGPSEDFELYPRDLERDLAAARQRRVDLVFAPAAEELYPRPLAAVVRPRRLADRMCGLSRPGHFEGVLTVVAKLFGIVQPDVSVFGQKDFQQAVLIRRMVEDLNLPVRVDVAPTVRETDGLAMSSRNAYLSPADRKRASSISRALAGAVAAFSNGERNADVLREAVLAVLVAAGGLDVEYAEVVSDAELEPVKRVDASSVVAVAVRVGATRLIDNVILGQPDPGLARLL